MARRRRDLVEHLPRLPADIAAGPLVERWGRRSELGALHAWGTAGCDWSRANGLGWHGWHELLPDEAVALVDDYIARRRARVLSNCDNESAKPRDTARAKREVFPR